MSASSSKLSSLLSTHALKLACGYCCHQENEITYTLRPVQHQCQCTVLLCKAKDGSKWRPISKRPTFPIPSKYKVCWHFKENFGCTVHKNRCTFARSQEEAAVWMFERQQGLDHQLLCDMVARTGREPQQANRTEPLQELHALIDLKVVCDLCSNKVNEITYTLHSVIHKCAKNLLLAKGRTSNHWRSICERPTGGNMGPNVLYKACDYYVEGSGCSQHKLGRGCSYARSSEEAMVWNYLREKRMDKSELIRLMSESDPDSETPESAAEKILHRFSGEFTEFCQECLLECPMRLTSKRWNETCAADTAHTWNPVLVHHLSEHSTKQIYSQIRPRPQNCPFEYCSHVRQGKPCWHKVGRCRSAQSEVEMVVWKAEHSGLSVRPHLLQLSLPKQTRSTQVTIFCKVCLLALSSPESFYRHCSSLEHAQLLSQDTTTKWKQRQPPHNRRAEFWFCGRPQSCEYGDNCPKAHSEAELQEWVMRAAEEKEIRDTIQVQGLMCYNQNLLEEYRNSSNEVYILCEQVDDVTICCDEDLNVEIEETNASGTQHRWNFRAESERQLEHVALLKQEPGASFSLGDHSSEPCIYSTGKSFLTNDTTYTFTVTFTSIHPGLYEQWLVLDFGMRPVLLKKLRVRVGQPTSDEREEAFPNRGASLKNVERWNRGNRVVVPRLSRTEEYEELLKEYKPPQMNLLFKSSYNKQAPLTTDNYKQMMHQFLYDEELAQDQIVSRLNVSGEVTTVDRLDSSRFGTTFAAQGELFCVVSIPYNLTIDSPEGLVLKNSIQSGLIAPCNSNHPNLKVYEATIVPHGTREGHIILQLSKQCCSDLALKSNTSFKMEVQFQLDRHNFCTMHKAVDLLPDTSKVLPDLRNCGVPVSDVTFEIPNTKQQAALSFILGNCDVRKSVAPLLIYGPFGTGKTFTLATAARALCERPQNRVLICTHTNSSADLYVRVHFHPFVTTNNDGLKPIRIKANKQGGAVFVTDQITLKYCFLSDDKQNFLPPTKAVLDNHNVVITTTSMAEHFHGLKLSEGYFTHILIDEASQMLECEALLALSLAGPNTRVVLAGDHMQMGPRLFSVDEELRSDCTLLTRLFHYYQGQKWDAAQNSRIIFSKNYRSTQEIVEFVSTHFYVGKNDVIEACGNVPAPENGHALKFHHVRGKCQLDASSLTWFNRQEVTEVVEIVKDILKNWPSTWGSKDQPSICVLSEGSQVRQIRTAFSRLGLSGINVESLANVQGKQFRVVIMTAVQTRDSLNESTLSGLPLFSDARVLNTAMTRAQSQVVVVGDAAALCCFGKCSRIWKNFIDHCISNNSAAPQHYTKDFFEKDVMETARFQRSEDVDESNTISDTILQELRDEYEQLKTEYSSDEESVEFQSLNHQKSGESDRIYNDQKELLELCEKQPDMFKRGKFVKESFKKGIVIPFNIGIQGISNMGMAFTGDEVVVQTATKEQTARVVGIIKKAESSRELACFLEDEDRSKRRLATTDRIVKRMMTPIKRSAPKICIHLNKKQRNFIPVWEQTDGHWTVISLHHVKEVRDRIFVVNVISWKEQCFYPLGNVTAIISKTGPLDDRLWLLKEEFDVATTVFKTNDGFFPIDEDCAHRRDERKAITFTVDPAGAEDLDDAISVHDTGKHYELGIHISDVASFVSIDGDLDMNAAKRGTTHYARGQKPIYMFPEDLSTGCFSLLPDQERRVVSLLFKVEKETNEIVDKPKLQLSKIKSNRKMTYEEAEKIITERYKKDPKFDTVENCVSVAYCFAKAQRKSRLVDWAYSQSDKERLPGKRKAHLMIEELNVLFNRHASEFLLESSKTRCYTPLRCQASLNPEKVENFKEKCGELIPLSFHVRHKVEHREQPPTFETFPILLEVWKDIQSAVRVDDTDKMVDLVAADDIYPLLQSILEQFRCCNSKAYIIRSNSSPKAQVGHYSLQLQSYTQASSPIRRYMDVILQRLLHSLICNKAPLYTRTDITTLCHDFESSIQKSKDYEQKAEQNFYAVSIKGQSATKLAFVVQADQEGDSFNVSFPFNRDLFPLSLSVMYNELQLEDQPSYNEGNHTITLKWKRRIYAADTMQIHQELSMMSINSPCIELPLAEWNDVITAIEGGNLDEAKSLLTKLQKHERKIAFPRAEAPIELSEHWVDILLQLRPGDTLQVQMTSEVKRGIDTPVIQLVRIKPKFEICVDHVHSPIKCFSQTADEPSKTNYRNTEEYTQIWAPMCEMESAANAVIESDSITIENLEVTFYQKRRGTLTGEFFLTDDWIKAWAIEVNLKKCLLCIRKRGLRLPPEYTPEHYAHVDPKEFTWVAHGVTTNVEELEKTGSKVDFYINHLPMETIPDSIFQKKASFTVEIIPKLLPDIRKEAAVINLPEACDLVRRIALGTKIPKKVVQSTVPKWRVTRLKLPVELPELNDSQCNAVVAALNNAFTLIQGPPGTGKTVVGVYLVYWFLELNSKTQRKFDDPKDKDRHKKEVILYCGPSNKSVDVVAEFLMKLKSLRILRVYSQKVESLEYPYPNSVLQFSPRTPRQDRSKPELRSITLHHRMRNPPNPQAGKIKAFDERIKRKEELTAEEVKEYRLLLRDAREYEFKQHDVILCTCTQSSTPGLIFSVSARQILIDECAMATEPQALIPLVFNKPEQIVLIGDHKQLRPVVKNQSATKLGMSESLFERYYTKLHENRAVMLDTQYRMHEDICKFPSEEFYDNKLKTGVEQPCSVLHVSDRTMPVVFGHVEGETVHLVVNTAKGNTNSKANRKERDHVTKIAKMLVERAKVDKKNIVILSPYNAQVSEIQEELQKMNLEGITVTTITKSQGSEWCYVIVSTVVSLPNKDIVKDPDGAWFSKHIGFVGDPNQINVAITRAKEGLCIIGNQNLLRCSRTWNDLLNHYTRRNAVTEADRVSVRHSRT
nr:helicase with zinc finger domain 2 isoform X3 [Nothobranchius furzeri]